MEKNRENYYRKFNTKEEEITKEKRGIALKGTNDRRQESDLAGQVIANKEEKRKELVARIIAAADRDWKLKELINEVKGEGEHVISLSEIIQSESEKRTNRKDISGDRRKTWEEEERSRRRRIVDRTRRNYWEEGKNEERENLRLEAWDKEV